MSLEPTSLVVKLVYKIWENTFGKLMYKLFFIWTCAVCKYLSKTKSKIHLLNGLMRSSILVTINVDCFNLSFLRVDSDFDNEFRNLL